MILTWMKFLKSNRYFPKTNILEIFPLLRSTLLVIRHKITFLSFGLSGETLYNEMSSLQRIISTVQTFNEDIILSIKESAQNLRSKYLCMYSSQTLGSLWRSYLPKAKILPKITFLQNENLQSDLRYGVTAVSKKLTPKSNEMNNWGIYQNPFICLFV